MCPFTIGTLANEQRWQPDSLFIYNMNVEKIKWLFPNLYTFYNISAFLPNRDIFFYLDLCLIVSVMSLWNLVLVALFLWKLYEKVVFCSFVQFQKLDTSLWTCPFWPNMANFGQFLPKWAKRGFFQKSAWNIFPPLQALTNCKVSEKSNERVSR